MSLLRLADQGSALFPVWIRPDADATELYAAQETVSFLSRMSGAAFSLVRSAAPPAQCIAIGLCGDWEAEDALGPEGFCIRTQSTRIHIVGGGPRGTLYGAYTFLEQLGCRWFSSKVSHIPSRSILDAPPMDIRQTPALEYRETFYVDSMDANWSARNKNNGHFARLDELRGGQVRYYPFVHTFDSLLSPQDHFDAHPEYFSEVDGKRLKEKTQLCLTNPEVIHLCAQKVEQWVEDQPEATIFSVSQNDWYNPCTCAHCRQIDEEEGSHAGSLIHFINSIAERIEKKYPHVVIDTLAYQYTRPAPKTLRPHPNVCVRLCTIECCFSRPLREYDGICSFTDRIRGDSFQKDLKDWAKVCDRLYVWDYVVNFSHYLLPFPNFHVLADNIRFFIENNVKGIFEEGATTVYGGAEFAELRAYVLAKLLWDPSQDTRALVGEFLSGYYRAAAGPIGEYFDLIQGLVESNPAVLFGIYDPPRVNYLTEEVVDRCHAMFARALALADDDAVLARVQIAHLPIRYWELLAMHPDRPNRAERIDELFDDLKRHGIHEIWEGRSMAQARERMNHPLEWRFPEDKTH